MKPLFANVVKAYSRQTSVKFEKPIPKLNNKKKKKPKGK